MEFSSSTRESLLKRAQNEEFDMLIIGGGITGAGIFRDAVMRGLRVILVEKNDFAFGTSSRSSKLVHGGLRYLEHFQFGLVFESTQERAKLMHLSRNNVRPQIFLFPVYKGDKNGLFLMTAGMWLYETLGGFKSYRLHKRYGRKALRNIEPCLKKDELKGGMTYYDCTVDDARLTLETIISGFNHGGVPLSYVKFEKAVEQNGKFTGGNVSDCLHRKNFEIKARCIVNATGPWTDATMSFFGGTDRPYLRPTQGSHLTVPSEKLHVNHAVVMNHPQDKRIMFAIPWGSHTIIGTTDTDYNQDLDQIYCTRKDVAYLLEALWHYFPDNKITEKDITGTWSGLRPLINQDTEKESDISREQKIWIDRRGLATIAGGKLTTYRLMAKELLDTALPQILPDASHGFTATEKEELPYAKNLPENIEQFDDYAAGLVRDRIISHEIVMRLLKDYGISASEIMRMMAESPDLANAVVENLPYVWADLEYSVKNEMCLTLADFMIRRTSIFYRMKDGGLAVIDRIVEKMTKLLGWDDARKQKEIEEYKSIVLKSRSAISS